MEGAGIVEHERRPCALADGRRQGFKAARRAHPDPARSVGELVERPDSWRWLPTAGIRGSSGHQPPTISTETVENDPKRKFNRHYLPVNLDKTGNKRWTRMTPERPRTK